MTDIEEGNITFISILIFTLQECSRNKNDEEDKIDGIMLIMMMTNIKRSYV